MEEKEIIKKIDYILEHDLFNHEGLRTLSVEEKVYILNQVNKVNRENINSIFETFVDFLSKHKLSIFEDNEMHTYLSNNPRVNNDFWVTGKYIFDVNDAIYVLTHFWNNFGHLEKFLVDVTKNINDANLIVKMYPELQRMLIPRPEYDNAFLNAISCLDNDRFKINFIKNPFFKLNNDKKAKLLCSLSSDQLKLDNLSMIPSRHHARVIASLKNDSIKSKYLDKGIHNAYLIIKSLDSDELREKYLNRYWSLIKDKNRAEIVRGFKNQELVNKYYQKLGTKGKTSYLTHDKSTQVTLDEVEGSIRSSGKSLDLINNLKNFTPDALIYLINNLNSLNARMVFANNATIVFEKLYNQYGLSECLRVLDALFNKIPQSHIIYFLKQESNLEIILHSLSYIHDIKGKVSVLVDGRYQDRINKSVGYDDKFLPLIKDFATYYQVSEENLKLVVERYDMLALRFLFKKNFRNILKLDKDTLENILDLMKVEYASLDDNTLNDIINSFVQRNFANKNRQVMSIFHDILIAIAEKKMDKLQELFKNIDNRIDVGSVLDDILNKKNEKQVNLIGKFYDGKQVNYSEFINLLLNVPEMMDILHEITNEYITIERSEYSKKETAAQRKLVTKETYNVNQMIKYIFVNNDIEEIYKAVKLELKNSIDDLNESEIAILKNDSLLKQLIIFNKNPNAIGDKPDNRAIGIFYSFLKKRINNIKNALIYNQKRISFDRKISLDNPNELVMEVISELEPKLLTKGIFSNPNVMKLLIGYLNKYKMLGWGYKLDNISSRADLLTSSAIIASFIMRFDMIYQFALNSRRELIRNKYPNLSEDELNKKAEKMISLAYLLDVTTAFSPSFKCYEKLFGKEDFRIILTDPQPYKSRYTKMEKLAETAKIYVEMYRRNKITVPPCDKDFELSSGKTMNIVVGNVTNPMNLDYGERTESCMRIGGFADSLFRFAALDKNGFHIRFVNPKNGELVSRVTGFRNGNTVFLNELRFSLSDEYTNSDVVEACQLISKYLVQATSDSKYPIENVIVSPYYAMAGITTNRVNLHMLSITKGLGNISHDIAVQPILLAGHNNRSYLTPISLGSDKVEIYTPQRDKVKLLVYDDLIDSIQRIESMSQMLDGKSIEEVNVNVGQDLLVGYVGEDFYCALTLDGTVVSKIINSRSNNKASLDEFNVYLEKLEANREVLVNGAYSQAIKKA